MKTYSTEKSDSFFAVNASLVESEIDYSSTVTFSYLVNLESIEAIRSALPKEQRPTYTAFIAKAVALAMTEFKYANRRFYRPFGMFPRRFQKFQTVDIAVASETTIPGVEYCAFIDVIREVENQSFNSVGQWLTALRTESDSNEQWTLFRNIVTRVPKFLAKFVMGLPTKFPSMWSKYRGGAVLISSPSKYGVESVVGAWTAPIGISYGLVKERPIADNGIVRAAPTFHFVMNFDRRLMAGAAAARFFNRMVEILENVQFVFANDPLIKSANEAKHSRRLMTQKDSHHNETPR